MADGPLIAIIIGLLLGSIHEAGQRGYVRSWGSAAQWSPLFKLFIAAHGFAFVAITTEVETFGGFALVSLCWLGSVKFAQLVIGTVIEAIEHFRYG